MRKVRPKEGNLFSQVQTVYISSELGFLGSRCIFTHHFILCPSSYPIHILLSLFFNSVTMPREGRKDGGSHPKTPEVKRAPKRDRDVHLSLDSWWSRGLQRILQGWQSGKMCLIGWTGVVPTALPWKQAFQSTLGLVTEARWVLPREGGGGEKSPAWQAEGEARLPQPPTNLASLCAELTRGSWWLWQGDGQKNQPTAYGWRPAYRRGKDGPKTSLPQMQALTPGVSLIIYSGELVPRGPHWSS